MNPILFFICILQCLSSILCLNCSNVRQTSGFGVYVKRDLNGGRSYWIYDKNGSEWEFFLTESNGQMEIKDFSNTTNSYDKRWAIRFGNNIEQLNDRVSQMCYNDSKIECYLRWNHKTEKSWVSLDMRNPLIFKTFPKSDNIEGNQYMVYDRHNKSDRLRL